MPFKPFVAILLLLLAGNAHAQPSGGLEAAVKVAAGHGFAGQVGLSDRSGTIFFKSVSAPGRSHSAGEVWRWASITKQVTATLILQEVEAGRLSLDDTLAARLPQFGGPNAGKITIRMLLQHTAGLPNPDDTGVAGDPVMPAFYRRATVGAGALSDAFGYCASTPKADAGAGFSYNNCDYIVLGAVLETSSGKPFARLVRDRISAPLRLRTLAVADDLAEPPTVRGWLDATHPEPPFHLATFGPSGALYGDPADLLAFDRGLMNGALLNPASIGLAWSGDPRLGYIALGAWAFAAPLKGCGGPVKLVERRGGIGGIEIRNLIAPEIGRALVVFSDRSDLDFGEIWQGKGLSFDLASAAFCSVRGARSDAGG